MKFTLSWLKDHLETTSSLDDILYALTDLGLEVEEVVNPAAKLAPFTIAKVLHAEKHPDADKLRVCRVLTDEGEKQIVCGAPNAREGITVVLCKPGDYVPGIDVTLGIGKIRGVESHGMMASEREQRSLFGEILDWMLAPLLLLWPMSVALTWLVAQNIAGKPFDRALEYNVGALAQLITVKHNHAQQICGGTVVDGACGHLGGETASRELTGKQDPLGQHARIAGGGCARGERHTVTEHHVGDRLLHRRVAEISPRHHRHHDDAVGLVCDLGRQRGQGPFRPCRQPRPSPLRLRPWRRQRRREYSADPARGGTRLRRCAGLAHAAGRPVRAGRREHARFPPVAQG